MKSWIDRLFIQIRGTLLGAYSSKSQTYNKCFKKWGSTGKELGFIVRRS